MTSNPTRRRLTRRTGALVAAGGAAALGLPSAIPPARAATPVPPPRIDASMAYDAPSGAWTQRSSSVAPRRGRRW